MRYRKYNPKKVMKTPLTSKKMPKVTKVPQATNKVLFVHSQWWVDTSAQSSTEFSTLSTI